jgi:hypothetical protein
MPPVIGKATYAVITGVAIVWVCLVFINYPGINGYNRAMFADMVYGKAYKPFVFRTLMPTTIRAIASAVPDSIHAKVSRTPIRSGSFNWRWEKEYLLEYYIATALMCFSLFAFYGTVRYLCTGIYRAPAMFVDYVSLGAICILPPFFKYYSYLYDFPALAFFTLGLALMVRRRWTAYLFLFPFACLNKETTILLTLVFMIHFRPSTRRLDQTRYIIFTTLQLVIFAVIKVFLSAVFRDNPGTMFEFHLLGHNLEMLTPYSLTTFLTWTAITLVLAYRWKEKPEFLRDAIWILPPLLALTLVFGYLDELRDYYEVLPVLLLLAAPSLAPLLSIKVENLTEVAG